MIVATRKAEGSVGASPQKKKNNSGQGLSNDVDTPSEFTDDMSEKEMMERMWKVMMGIKEDTQQAKEAAAIAASAADNATEEIQEMKTTIQQ